MKESFLYDPRVYPLNLTVKVHNGVVTLTGVVGNLKARNAAVRDVQNTLGVWRVVDLLKVRPPNTASDAAMAKQIREALVASPFVDRFDVVVRVVNRKAYLSGLADSPFEKTEAGRVASGVPGVVRVRNDLSVLHAPYVYSYWNYYSRYNKPLMLGPLASPATDRQIKRRIENQLFWSPYVDRRDITVTVKDGIATLQGTVDRRRERRVANENAYEGGALAVRDEIKVNGEPAS